LTAIIIIIIIIVVVVVVVVNASVHKEINSTNKHYKSNLSLLISKKA